MQDFALPEERNAKIAPNGECLSTGLSSIRAL